MLLESIWKDEASADYALNAANLSFIMPDFLANGNRLLSIVPANRRQIALEADIFVKLIVNGLHIPVKNKTYVTIAPETILDVGSSFTPGKDYSLYLVQADAGADLVCSLNSTYPAGATADNSRKIGGFHTVCANVGTIVGHPYSEYMAGDIHIHSLWDLKHRPICSPDGMAYVEPLGEWWDIYGQSGTGTSTASVFGGTATVSRNYMDHVDDFAAVGKNLIWDEGFQIAAEGSNQKTSFSGGAGAEPNPKTQGGHSDSTGRRMISNFGLEDMCGWLWWWARGGGWRFSQTTHTDSPATSGPNYEGSYGADIQRHDDWPGNKGSVWHTDGRAGLLVGALWVNGSASGSRARYANYPRSALSTSNGGRACARSR
ncbi:MAG: hypothetical protein LBR82_02085 [Desulfovibrio sp.]|jgi:hypothetical protein|nr:hypothetical protein [Desulfovibrio sp.]